MSILIGRKTKVIVQGMTGHQGSFHTKQMLEYGTKIVAGVTPGKGGEKVEGVPVYDTVQEALQKQDADFSVLFVPAPHAKEAAIEALENGLHIVIITEHVPIHDAMSIIQLAKKKKLHVLGPNCPGLATPGMCKIGIMPGYIFQQGNVGVVSRSGTLTYEIVHALTKAGIGQSTVVGIGGDPIIGMDFLDILPLFEKDKQTKQIVLVGEIGGDAEERAAAFIKKSISKPVVAYIAGTTAPEGKRMGHAGAIIEGRTGTAQHKIQALQKAGIPVAKLPSEIVQLLE